MLENTHIKLRELEPSDIDFLFETENNMQLWEISNTLKPFSRHNLTEYIKNSAYDIFTTKQLRLIIEIKKDKKVTGIIDLFNYDPVHLRAGTGIYIKKEERKKGYASQALELLKEYSKNILMLNQLYCEISEDNIESIKLFEKSGFKINGKKEKWINTPGGFKNVLFLQHFFNE